jgi:hypothetical protein
MINSFIQLVHESAEVSEMGLKNIETLTNSELGPIRKFTLVLKELLTAMRAMKGSDIVMEQQSNQRRYYPRLPQNVVALMRELQSVDQGKTDATIGNWKDLDPDNWDTIYFKTDAPDLYQRSHFPNGGIPVSLRGIGLGGKLYRALVKKVGYISSNTSGTREKDNAWGTLLSFKGNPDGTPSSEDVHGIVGPSSWMAIDRSLPDNKKAEIAMNFINGSIRPRNTDPNEFDMDDDLLDVLPDDFLSGLSGAYLRSLVTRGRLTQERLHQIESSRGEAERRERERMETAAAAERERLAREERLTRKRLIARIARFGADPDADWDLRDYIVVKQYLYQADYELLPIRRVEAIRNGEYVAVSIKDAIRLQNNEITLDQCGDTRTTRDKTRWVKVNLNEIPDLDNVNLSPPEKRYIESQLNPDVAARIQAERDEEERLRREREREANAPRVTANRPAETFGMVPSGGAEIKDWLTDRPNHSTYQNTLRLFKDPRFVREMRFIVLGPPQRAAMRNSWGIPVFIPWIRNGRNGMRPIMTIDELNGSAHPHLTNAVTGFELEGPFSGLGLTAYPLAEVTIADKLGARAGEHFYVAAHQNTYGIIAKSDYGAVNTNRQRFIYIKAYGFAGRSVSVRLDLLRKLGAPVEV